MRLVSQSVGERHYFSVYEVSPGDQAALIGLLHFLKQHKIEFTVGETVYDPRRVLRIGPVAAHFLERLEGVFAYFSSSLP